MEASRSSLTHGLEPTCHKFKKWNLIEHAYLFHVDNPASLLGLIGDQREIQPQGIAVYDPSTSFYDVTREEGRGQEDEGGRIGGAGWAEGGQQTILGHWNKDFFLNMTAND